MYSKLIQAVSKLKFLEDFLLLFIRAVLAYGFYTTASVKWQNISSVSEWFASLGIPLPVLNTYLAASTEAAGVILLTLGLGVRLISIPLMFVMVVAIVTVHAGNGFEAGNNGFEIPLYYLILLLSLVIYGGGKFSLDNLIISRIKKSA